MRTPLHIGWWRNGFHQYEMLPTKPTEQQIRKCGAMVAAAICGAWTVSGAIVALLLLGSWVGLIGALVAVGGLAAMPVFAALGWRFGPRAVRRGDASLPMTIWVVFVTDLEIVIVTLLAAGVAMVIDSQRHDLVWVGQAILVGAAGGAALYLLGLTIFGLPGLVMALVSTWMWDRTMRRTFMTTARAGGDRGSAGQHH